MTLLLQIGFGLLVLGLNLMMIYVALNTAGDDMPANNKKLKLVGLVVLSIGGLIILLGVLNHLFISSSESTLILSSGLAVFILGFATLIRILGQKHTQVVWGGALVTAGIGLGFVLSYVILYFVD